MRAILVATIEKGIKSKGKNMLGEEEGQTKHLCLVSEKGKVMFL